MTGNVALKCKVVLEYRKRPNPKQNLSQRLNNKKISNLKYDSEYWTIYSKIFFFKFTFELIHSFFKSGNECYLEWPVFLIFLHKYRRSPGL